MAGKKKQKKLDETFLWKQKYGFYNRHEQGSLPVTSTLQISVTADANKEEEDVAFVRTDEKMEQRGKRQKNEREINKN